MRKPLLLILLLGSIVSYSNETTTYTPREYSIMPASPNVSSLIKYNDISVNHFNGLPDISFPLYTVQEGSLSVPITLSYHGGGIRVSEWESNMGLGWTLFTSGVVSRTTYGHPDEMSITKGNKTFRGILNHTPTDINFRQFAINTVADFDPTDFLYYQNNRLNTWLTMGSDYIDGYLDMANDIFKVNCMGLSGTFIYNDSHDLVLSSTTPFAVLPSHIMSSYPMVFEITDTKGTKYYFTEREETRHVYYYGQPEWLLSDSLRYTSAWYLTKVKNIHNDSIVFHYTQEDFEYQQSLANSVYYYNTNPSLEKYTPNSPLPHSGPKYYPKRLSSIESSSAIVYFHYNENHLSTVDVIDRIVVKTNNDQRQVIKDYSFEYEFYNNTNNQRRRLMLKSIKEANNNIYVYKYQFTYHGLDGETDIPFRYSDQDFCGYYNDAGNNGLVPYYLPFGGDCSNREVNPNVSMYGSLKTIEYPTGGKTEFEWESHDYGSIQTRPVEMKMSDKIISVEYDTLVGLTPCQKLIIDNFRVTSNQDIYLDLTQYFNFNPQILMTTEYEHNHEYNEYTAMTLNYPTVVFINKSTNKTSEDLTFYLDKNTIEDKYDNKVFELAIPNGIYQVKLLYPTKVWMAEEQILREFYHADANCGRIVITKHIKGEEGGSSMVNKDYWGGVRIKKISSYTHSNADPIIKKYFYNSDLNPAKSSGVIAFEPHFVSKYYMVCTHQSTVGWDAGEVFALSSVGLHNLPVGNVGIEYETINESYVTYDKTSGMEQVLKRSKYDYTVQDKYYNVDYNRTQFLNSQPVGQQMWTSVAHRRGNLTKKTDFYISSPASETHYEYNIYEPDEYSLFTTDMFLVSDYTPAFGQNQLDYSIGKYHLIPYNKTIKTELYTESSGYNQTINYTYFYDEYTSNPDYRFIRSKQITESYGSDKTIYYTYVKSGNTYLDIIESEVTVSNGIIIDAKRMEYYPGTFLLKSVYGLSELGKTITQYPLGEKSASQSLISLINEPEYSYRYDSSGNLVEIKFKNEVLASYLWGYRGAHPIVEVKNFPYDSLVSTLASLGKIPENFLSATGTTTSDLNTFYSQLRTTLPNYEITTMLYHWLIGVSEATDSKGITTHFTYDDWGRLKDIKDYNQYFIRKYDYHFKE